MAFWCCASIAALHVSLPACRCVVSWSLNSKKAKFSKPLADRKNCSWRYTLGSKHREPSTLPAQQLPVCLVLKLATRTTVDYRSCGCVLCSACTGSADSETGLYNLWHAVVRGWSRISGLKASKRNGLQPTSDGLHLSTVGSPRRSQSPKLRVKTPKHRVQEPCCRVAG